MIAGNPAILVVSAFEHRRAVYIQHSRIANTKPPKSPILFGGGRVQLSQGKACKSVGSTLVVTDICAWYFGSGRGIKARAVKMPHRIIAEYLTSRPG